MNDFVNRMSMQRRVLRSVNGPPWTEKLFGLSNSAIHRWAHVNHLTPNSKPVRLVEACAEALTFLATKSQDQISEADPDSDTMQALVESLEDYFETEATIANNAERRMRA